MGTSQPKAIPEGMHSLTPHLNCAGAADAIEFYRRAFGAIELGRLEDDEKRIMHAMLRIGNSSLMLNDEFPDCPAASVGPKTLKGSPVTIHLYVDDVDGTMAQAASAGATVTMPATDMFWGDRYGTLTDPFGHHWSVATHVRDVSPEDMKKAVKEMKG